MLIARIGLGVFSVAALGLSAGASVGQDFPTKAIRIVTSTPGGGSDFAARIIAQGITGPLGQQIIVDNRSGVIGQEMVIKSVPDGYTLIVDGSSLWLGPLVQTLPYEVKDFAPISLLARVPNILVVHPSVPVKSVKELIALAKARPGDLNYASGNAGSSAQLSGELFKSMAGVNIVMVPYKGTGPALTALIGGEVQLMFTTSVSVGSHVKTGRLRALAVTSEQPSALAPGLPTVSASGLPGYNSSSATGILAPAKTPTAIINRLNQEIVRVITSAEIKERFFNNASEIVGSSAEEFAETIKTDISKMGKVIKDAGIRIP
jgi:tripartite-type tricarboxylate transporter receptor subunit TctC